MAESFESRITKLLNENQTLTTKEIYSLFPEMNSQTVSWHLHKQMVKGNIVQASHGVYVLPKTKLNDETRISKLPQLSLSAFDILSKAGYNFYLSGLDTLNGLGFSVSGNYPVIVCTEKSRVKDVQLLLMREFDVAISEYDYSVLDNVSLRKRTQFVVLGTDAFELSKGHFALPEKAFVDLYYAISRLDYPVPVKELPHVLSLIKPNLYKFKMATKDRKVSDELNFLMHYNREFVKALADYL